MTYGEKQEMHYHLNEQVERKRPNLRTRNYCVRNGSSAERRVEPGK